MTLTQAEMERRYDLTRLSPITSYPTPIPLSAQEEEILTLLLALSEPDPEELDDRIVIAREIDRVIAAEKGGADIDEVIAMLEQAGL